MSRALCALLVLALLLLVPACAGDDGMDVGAGAEEPAVSLTAVPTPESVRRRVEAEAPARMKRGVAVPFYLSFGPTDLPSALPNVDGSQRSEQRLDLPTGGQVTPQLQAVPSTGINITPVHVEPVAVDTPGAVLWEWTILVDENAALDQGRIRLRPTLLVRPTVDAPARKWPVEEFEIEVEVHPRGRVQTALHLLGRMQGLLALLGIEVAALAGGVVTLVRWLLPRLRHTPAAGEPS